MGKGNGSAGNKGGGQNAGGNKGGQNAGGSKGGQGAGLPSTTGKPSGGGRDNAPAGSKK